MYHANHKHRILTTRMVSCLKKMFTKGNHVVIIIAVLLGAPFESSNQQVMPMTFLG